MMVIYSFRKEGGSGGTRTRSELRVPFDLAEALSREPKKLSAQKGNKDIKKEGWLARCSVIKVGQKEEIVVSGFREETSHLATQNKLHIREGHKKRTKNNLKKGLKYHVSSPGTVGKI